ncbi:putative alpha-L-fucosidase [Diaphorina citri]|uniref:alpha-L-fucosidase n=1 Tax=Diaphorina citri TaxID=121845 RepID=A0A1S3DQJ7_DIACI|nr:putative alpha-L-fucosidase [Diaphorina citri]
MLSENPNSTVTKFMERNYKPGFTYQDFAKDFTAEFFDANHWADILASSGAKYVVLTSKHHEGYTLWPSKYAFSWNSMDIGPKRDLVGEFEGNFRSRVVSRIILDVPVSTQSLE